MILVQNHQPQLNGNRHFLILVASVTFILFFSCSSKQYALEQAKLESQYYKTRNENTQSNPKDSLKEEIKTSDTISVIYPREIKEKYNIALLLPLMLDNIYDKEFVQRPISIAAQEFYMGALIAIEDTSGYHLNYSLHIIDNKRSKEYTSEDIIAKLNQREYDLIIGPFLTSNVRVISDYSFNRKIPLISPVANIDSCLHDNPYFISLKPSKTSYVKYLSHHLKEHHQTQNIIFTAESKEQLDYYLSIVNGILDTSKFNKFNTVILNNSNWRSAPYNQYLGKENNIFVFCIEDEILINSVINSLVSIEKEMLVYAPFQWLNFNSVDINYLQRINTCFLADQYIDYDDSSNCNFIHKYREKFNTEPGKYALLGYQTFMYFPQLMKKHGKYFFQEAFINGENKENHHLMIERINSNAGYQNTKIFLLQLKDNELVRWQAKTNKVEKQ